MIDTEDSADKTQLRELIRQENNIANKKLCDEITNLKRHIATAGVKGQRGPKKSGGASLQKQIPSTPSSNSKSSSRKKKGSKNAQKAGVHDKGTTAAEKKRSKKKSGQKTTRKSRHYPLSLITPNQINYSFKGTHTLDQSHENQRLSPYTFHRLRPQQPFRIPS